jgi:hypothetical protein
MVDLPEGIQVSPCDATISLGPRLYVAGRLQWIRLLMSFGQRYRATNHFPTSHIKCIAISGYFWNFLVISGTKFCCILFPFDEDHGPNLTTIRPACNRKCRASRSSLCLVVAHCARRTPQGRGKIRQQRLTLLEYWALTATRCVYTSNMHINTNQPILYISIHLSSSVYLFTVSLFMCMCWCVYMWNVSPSIQFQHL